MVMIANVECIVFGNYLNEKNWGPLTELSRERDWSEVQDET